MLLACWVASAPGAAPAQAAAADKCSYRAIVTAVRTGQTPDVSGCNPIIIFRNLQEAGLRPIPAAAPDADIERGLVSRVAIQDRTATIYVSTGAPPAPPPAPPAPEQEPAGTPPPPVIVDPALGPKPPAPPPRPTADPAPIDPPRPTTETGPVSPPPEAIPSVNPDDPALTNNVAEETTTAETGEIEAASNAAGDGAGAGPAPPPTWFERLQAGIPWWPIPAVLLGLGAIAYGIRKIWPPAPPPALYPTWDVEAGTAAIEGKLPASPAWPSFAARTAIEWGGVSLPQPLPLAEAENG